MRMDRSHRRGFTLIEMLIVGALIVLFAGLAMIGAQQMYESNRRKAMYDETKSIGSTLAFAYQDVGFYPRIGLLGLSLDSVRFNVGTAPAITYKCRPGMDNYGFYGSGTYPAMQNPLFALQNWKAPYLPVSELRAMKGNRGRSGVVKMRLSDAEYQGFNVGNNSVVAGEDLSLVDWPTDTWANPYVLYQVVSDPAYVTGNNPKGLRLVKSPREEGSFFTAVVSYGPNGVPGGGDIQNLSQYPGVTGPAMAQAIQQAQTQMLYVKGDPLYSGNGPKADYTLKSYSATNPVLRLDFSVTAMAALAESIQGATLPNVGIMDNGSDDVYYKFN